MSRKSLCVLLIAGAMFVPLNAEGGLFRRCGRRGVIRRCPARDCCRSPRQKESKFYIATGWACPQAPIAYHGTYTTYYAMRCFNGVGEQDQPTILDAANNLPPQACDSTGWPCVNIGAYSSGVPAGRCNVNHLFDYTGIFGFTHYPDPIRIPQVGVQIEPDAEPAPEIVNFTTDDGNQVLAHLYWLTITPDQLNLPGGGTQPPMTTGIGYEIPAGTAESQMSVPNDQRERCHDHSYLLRIVVGAETREYQIITHRDTN